MAPEKKTDLKKWLNILPVTAFALLFLFVLSFSSARADLITGECGANGASLTWTLDDEGTLTISGNGPMQYYNYQYSSSGSSVTNRPESWNRATRLVVEEGVTRLGGYAFYRLENLTEVTLPDSLTEISYDAFAYCGALTGVVLPDGLTTIGNCAFISCESLTEIILPDSVTSLDTSAFSQCRNLASVSISGGLTEIPDSTFSSCESLTSVVIPEGITSLGSWSFQGCYSLQEIQLPESLTGIGTSAFSNAKSLSAIRIPNGVRQIGSSIVSDAYTVCFAELGSDASVALDRAGTPFHTPEYPNLGLRYDVTGDASSALKVVKADAGTESAVLPGNTVSIGERAFYNCKYLNRITLPDGLTSIGQYAFYGCDSLSEITIPEGVSEIPYYCFGSCDHLRSVFLPGHLTSIGENAFSSCRELESLSLPETLVSIGQYAFYNCDSLTEMTIPEGISEIPAYCLCDCSQLKSVRLPDSLISIGANAFSYCHDLKSITLPENVATVGSRALSPCWRLVDVYLPAKLNSIADDALWDPVVLLEMADAGINCRVLCWEYSYAEGWALDHNYPVTLMDGKTPDEYTSVALPESVLLGVGFQAKLKASVFPDFSSVSHVWTSSDPGIAAVDGQGRVTALQPGDAEITLTVNGCSAVCALHSVIPAVSLSLPETVYVPAKGSAVLPLTVSPADAVTVLTYTAEDSSYASVNEEGLLTGRAIGRTVLTVTDEVSGLSCSAEVQVTYPVSSVAFPQDRLVLRIGTEAQLEAQVTAHSLSFVNQLVTFSSSDPEVASVDRNGRVMPLKTGRATVTASASGASGETVEAQCQLIVLPPDDDSVIIELEFNPEEPLAGNLCMLSWNILGPADHYVIEVGWSLDSRNESISDALNPAPAFGSVVLTPTARASIEAYVSVWDDDDVFLGNRQISVQAEEPSGIVLTVTPEEPQSGEAVTISWEISRPEEHTAGIYGTLFAGGMEKQAFGLDEIEDQGSFTYLPEEGNKLQITAWVDISGETLEELHEIPLQTDHPVEPIRISVFYPQTSVQLGSPISAEYRVTGGSGVYSGNLECHWIRVDGQDNEQRLHNRLMTGAEGQWTDYLPEWPGTYIMAMDVTDSSGWAVWDIRDESSAVSVTGNPVPGPLGISFLNPVPPDVDLEEGYSFDWDVTGGDDGEWRMTTVHAETDDGVVLELAGEAYGCTNYWWIQAEDPSDIAGSKFLILELTPADSHGPGSTVMVRIPLFCFDLSQKITLPANLLRIEDEAFAGTDATVFDIPASVVYIGEDAFPRSAGLLVEAGSEAQRWAEANEYHYRVK